MEARTYGSKKQFVIDLLGGEEIKLRERIDEYDADVEAFSKSSERNEKERLEKARASKAKAKEQLERFLGMLLIASIAEFIDEDTYSSLQTKYIDEVYG